MCPAAVVACLMFQVFLQAREQEKIAKRHIHALNPDKLSTKGFQLNQASMKKRLAELEAQASAAAEVISKHTRPSASSALCEHMMTPCYMMAKQVSKAMKALETELATLKKRLQEAEDELRKKQKEAEEAKVGPCYPSAPEQGQRLSQACLDCELCKPSPHWRCRLVTFAPAT